MEQVSRIPCITKRKRNFQGKNLTPKMNSARKRELKLTQLFVRLQ